MYASSKIDINTTIYPYIHESKQNSIDPHQTSKHRLSTRFKRKTCSRARYLSQVVFAIIIFSGLERENKLFLGFD